MTHTILPHPATPCPPHVYPHTPGTGQLLLHLPDPHPACATFYQTLAVLQATATLREQLSRQRAWLVCGWRSGSLRTINTSQDRFRQWFMGRHCLLPDPRPNGVHGSGRWRGVLLPRPAHFPPPSSRLPHHLRPHTPCSPHPSTLPFTLPYGWFRDGYHHIPLPAGFNDTPPHYTHTNATSRAPHLPHTALRTHPRDYRFRGLPPHIWTACGTPAPHTRPGPHPPRTPTHTRLLPPTDGFPTGCLAVPGWALQPSTHRPHRTRVIRCHHWVHPPHPPAYAPYPALGPWVLPPHVADYHPLPRT